MSNGPFQWGEDVGASLEPPVGVQQAGFTKRSPAFFQHLNWLGMIMFRRFKFAGIDGDGQDVTAAATLTKDSPRYVRYASLGANINQTLPTTGVLRGKTFTLANADTHTVTVKASDGSTICVIAAGYWAEVFAKIDTPVASTDWQGFNATSTGLVVCP